MKRLLVLFVALTMLSLATAAPAQEIHVWQEVGQQTARYAPYGLNRAKAAFFKGFFYVIGTKSAIWRSVDGRTWDKLTDQPPFGRRFGHCLLVFNNRLWLLGGSKDAYITDYQPQNDIWYTEDGINWKRAVEHAPWSARFDHAAIVFNNKMWIFGGSRAKGPGSKRQGSVVNDVWYSSNGINWTGTLWGAEWAPRAGHEVIVYQNKLWLTGGNNFNDLWFSSNGLEWNLREDKCPWSPRRGHALMDIGGRLWVIGGEAETTAIGGLLNDAWSTLDGLYWQVEHNDLTDEDGSWCERANIPCCKGSDGYWYMFPSHGAGIDKNDSWKMSLSGEFGGRLIPKFTTPLGTTNIYPLVHNGMMYVFTPRILWDWYPPTAWTSKDGSHWAAMPLGFYKNKVWYTGQVFSFQGYLWALENQKLYKSTNGGGWSYAGKESDTVPSSGPNPYIIGYDGRMWLINPGPPTEIFQSPDNGTTWIKTIYSSQNLDLGSNIVTYKNYMWSFNKIIRYARDGIQWVPSKNVPWTTGNFKILVMGDRLWSVTDLEGIWSSDNGMDWTRVYYPAKIPPNEAGPLRNTLVYDGKFWNFTTGKPPAGGPYDPDLPSPGKAWNFDFRNAAERSNWLYYR